ncbi:MAG: DNA-directed RNA polymerase subunit alpha [Candidatus Improbicoccus pseudotrichonymphae]|uniref:DNA-directed RNA polymerase subunit alpha n=1 Tax=Candidatus Improbicoccus pseudotrichonymphae TaxID=3033792 RepID=A0AA48L0N6_9FIRM|nr:MAG: DNA-directed RNA polymerase subunit alpha [Candidatus Improbicoccus pseudotrichonymphae]
MSGEMPKIKVLEESENGEFAKLEIEPLARGFGNSLGNSLRRVLLSVLPGVAPYSVKINGVMHEFSTVPGVKEDVTDLILNIKGIIAKFEGVDKKTVLLKVNGPTNVTAGMIEQDAEFEIINKDLHIATLDEGHSLDMELTFNSGVGYVSAEQNRSFARDFGLGTIAVDSIYTPVKKVNIYVSNTRVGRFIDFDKLTIEIWTNEVLSAKEAVSLAALKLIKHYELFSSLSDLSPEISEVLQIDIPKEDIEDKSIDDMGLSVRTHNSLRRAGIQTLREIIAMPIGGISKIRNLGKKSFDELMFKLQEYGYDLPTDSSLTPFLSIKN